MEIRVYKNPADHDSDDVVFLIDGQEKGAGYIGKKDKKIGLIRCPKCDRENYMMNVLSGQCCWCGFKA